MTCFKYRQCHDNMPDSTYKSHLHNVSPLSLSFSLVFFFFFLLPPPRRQAAHTRHVLPLSRPFGCKKMSCQVFLRHKKTQPHTCVAQWETTEYKRSAWRRWSVVKTNQVSCDITSNDKDPPKKLVSTVCPH